MPDILDLYIAQEADKMAKKWVEILMEEKAKMLADQKTQELTKDVSEKIAKE